MIHFMNTKITYTDLFFTEILKIWELTFSSEALVTKKL